jgi:hypothetical protein
MTGLAADLTDRVIPFVPVRQFVLSVPHRLRYLLAYDHERCIAILRIFNRALLCFYRMRARKHGAGRGRTGSVTFLQRFGSAANCTFMRTSSWSTVYSPKLRMANCRFIRRSPRPKPSSLSCSRASEHAS